MLTSLRVTDRLSLTVIPEHSWALLWKESSQSRQFHLTSLGVANLCSLMTDLISEHSLVAWSCLDE